MNIYEEEERERSDFFVTWPFEGSPPFLLLRAFFHPTTNLDYDTRSQTMTGNGEESRS